MTYAAAPWLHSAFPDACRCRRRCYADAAAAMPYAAAAACLMLPILRAGMDKKCRHAAKMLMLRLIRECAVYIVQKLRCRQLTRYATITLCCLPLMPRLRHSC